MGTQNIIITNHNNKIIITKQHINKTSYWEGVTHVFEDFVCPPKSANMFPQEKNPQILVEYFRWSNFGDIFSVVKLNFFLSNSALVD